MASKNWGLQVPTKTTPLTPLATPFALLASSISDALTAVLSGSAKKGTTSQRDAFYGVPTSSADQIALQGAEWYNTSTNKSEVYAAAYNATTNPFGARTAGWFPAMPAFDEGYQAVGAIQSPFTERVACMYRVQGNRVSLSGSLYSPTAPSVALAFTLPSRVTPRGAISIGGVADWAETIQVGTNGQVTISANIARTSGVGYQLDGISWPFN